MRERWLSRRAVTLHIAVILFVPVCALAAWWQITRAFDGNGLSYLYSVEWPIFAILAVYFWWMLIHTDYDTVGLKGMQNQKGQQNEVADEVSATTTAVTDPVPVLVPGGEDPELDAYNARLAELSAHGPKTWRHPETPVARRSR